MSKKKHKGNASEQTQSPAALPPDLEQLIDLRIEVATLRYQVAELLRAAPSSAGEGLVPLEDVLAQYDDLEEDEYDFEDDEGWQPPTAVVYRWNPDTWEAEAVEERGVWADEDIWDDSLAEVLEEGKYLRTSRGTLWEVAPEDRSVVRGWLPGDELGMWLEDAHKTPPLYRWIAFNVDLEEDVWGAPVSW